MCHKNKYGTCSILPSVTIGKPVPGGESMALFDDWSQLVTKVLISESDLVAKLLHHAVELGNAREALIRGILERFVPSIYEIGTGQIVDCAGTYSKQID